MNSIKRIFSLIIINLITVQSFGQFNREYKEFSLEINGGYLEPNDYDPVPAGGFSLNYQLGKRVSVISRFAYGPDHLHFSPSLITAPLFIYTEAWKNSNIYISSNFFYNVLIMASALENVGFHFPVRDKLELVPNLSLLSFRSFRKVDPIPFDPERTLWGNSKPSGAVGIKVNILMQNNFYISPYAEAYLQYNRDGTWGTNFGGSIGYMFKSNNTKNNGE